MATAGKSGKGVKIKMGNGATPEVFTAVAEVKDIAELGATADDLDSTSLDSDEKESIAGLTERSEITCEAIAVAGNTEQNAIEAAVGGAAKNWQVTLPEGGGWTIPARVKKASRKFGTNQVRMFSFTLKPTGAPTPIAP